MKELISIIGLGYIGLPTALMMAANGLRIIGIDNNSKKIETLKQGKLTFYEKGIMELYNRAVDNDIIFSDEYPSADVYIVSVPTPFDKKSKKVVATYLIDAVKNIIEKSKEQSVIVVESTVSPGTIDLYIRPMVEQYNTEHHMNISLAHAPERIIPGKMIEELRHNSRTIGADNQAVAEKVKAIYETFCEGEIILTNIKTAEMSKVVENAFRDINIAYANELVKICRTAEVDVYELISIANKHPRVNILSPGPGVGGHCISVDPWFLVGDYPGLANIILAARKINDSMPEYVLQRTYDIMQENSIVSVERVGLYGLTYKENVDDVRESPALQMIDCMKRHLAQGIKVYDPFVEEDIVDNQYHDFDSFINDIDLIVILVGHTHIFNNRNKLENVCVFDTRNVIDGKGIYRL